MLPAEHRALLVHSDPNTSRDILALLYRYRSHKNNCWKIMAIRVSCSHLFFFLLLCLLIPDLLIRIANNHVTEHGKEGILWSKSAQKKNSVLAAGQQLLQSSWAARTEQTSALATDQGPILPKSRNDCWTVRSQLFNVFIFQIPILKEFGLVIPQRLHIQIWHVNN